MKVPRLTLPVVAVCTAAILLSTSGTAYAIKMFTGANIKNGTLTGLDIKTNSVPGTDIKDNTISGSDVLDNSLRSIDVLNGTLASVDVADNSLTSLDILNGTLTSADVADDSLTADDLADGSVGSSELATDSVNATEIADNTIDAGEIIDFSLTNEDIGVLEAEVNSDGVLASSDHSGTSSSTLGTGLYVVDFGQTVSFCTPVVSQGEAGVGGAGGAIMGVTDRSGNPNAFFVTTKDAAGSPINTSFHIIVVC